MRHRYNNTHALCVRQPSAAESMKREVTVGEGGKATLLGAPDVESLREAIEEL